MSRALEEINAEYQAAAAALGQAAYHKAKLEGQIAHLTQRMAALEDEHATLRDVVPARPAPVPAPKKGEKAAKRRAAALAKAEAVRAKRGSKR